ncbi:hypothetical protein OKW30_000860 [Paraburkholderia sp. Clong3]
MTPHDLAKFEAQRRHATLAAIVMEATATVTDEIDHLHDRIIGRLFNAAKKPTIWKRRWLKYSVLQRTSP